MREIKAFWTINPNTKLVEQVETEDWLSDPYRHIIGYPEGYEFGTIGLDLFDTKEEAEVFWEESLKAAIQNTEKHLKDLLEILNNKTLN